MAAGEVTLEFDWPIEGCGVTMRTPEEKLREIFDSKFPEGIGKCEACGQQNWAVDGSIYELRQFHGGNFIVGVGGGIIPVVPVTCTNCGHVRLHNAIALGILGADGKPT